VSETGYKIRNQEAIHYCTFSIVYWIDIFSRFIYRDIIIESLAYCQKEKGLVIYAWVIMSNHVHVIIRSETGKLSDTIRDFKLFTSKEIVEAVKTNPESRREWMLWIACPGSSGFERAAGKHKRNTKYQVWKHDNHPEELESNKFIEQKLEYIHQNPVRACIVQNP
jgi:putative transposase